MLVWASPADGRDEEFLHWYDTVHIPDIRTAVAAVAGVTRYRMTGSDGGPPRYLTVYELEDADTDGAMKAIGDAATEGRMEMTSAMDMADRPPVVEFYVPAGGTEET
jgi:hypothetical protein